MVRKLAEKSYRYIRTTIFGGNFAIRFEDY